MFSQQIKKIDKVQDLPKVTQCRWCFVLELHRMAGPWKVAVEARGEDTNIHSRVGRGDQ